MCAFSKFSPKAATTKKPRKKNKKEEEEENKDCDLTPCFPQEPPYATNKAFMRKIMSVVGKVGPAGGEKRLCEARRTVL